MVAAKTRILLVDDEAHQRAILGEFLGGEGYSTVAAANGVEALKVLQDDSTIRLVITDLSMPGMSGIELIQKARALRTDLDFLMVTAHGSIETAIQAMKLGAYDYLLKPLEHEEVALRVRKALDVRELERRAAVLEKENRSLRDDVAPIADSKPMKELLAELERAAKTDATVILTGETGVGKEVLSRFLHQRSGRSRGPFVAVNCSAIPENLLESEFFGHEKGAFTGADRRSIGLFEQADGGTLFLDEIGEMDLKLQPKILRAIEDRRVRRVAGTADIPVDIRLVAATNRDLKALVADGRFREDLYYRLNVVQVRIPALRDRTEDVPGLVSQLVKRYSRRLNVNVRSIDPGYLDALARYRFPGNVRELANTVERSLIYMNGGVLTSDTLPSEVRSGEGAPPRAAPGPAPAAEAAEEPLNGRSLGDLVSGFEKKVIEGLLASHKGDVDQVARELGVAKSTLYAKISKYGVKLLVALALSTTLSCFEAKVAQQVPPVAEEKAVEQPAQARPVPGAPEKAREAVATLEEIVADVKTRRASELVWASGAEKTALGNQDAVKTGAHSTSVIRFSDRTVLNMGELSMVIVVDRKRDATVDRSVIALPAGTLDGKLAPGGKVPVEVVVKTRRGWIKASSPSAGAEFKAAITPTGALKVSTSAGEVKLVSKSGERQVRPNEVLTLPEPEKISVVANDGDAERPALAEFDELPEVPEKEWKRVVVTQSHSPSAKTEVKTEVARVVRNEFRILSPTNRSVVDSPKVTVSGVLSGSMKAYLNGKGVPGGSSGKFSLQIPLTAGANVLTFQVVGPTEKDIRYETLEVMRK